jgi:predicted dehydrogenase
VHAAGLVVCEKPLGLTAEAAAGIRDELGTDAGKVVLAFNQRFMPGVRELHAWLRTGTVEVRRVRIDITTPPFLESWAGTAERGGGILVGVGSHAVDLWRHLFGRRAVEVAAVATRTHVSEPLEHDTAAVTLVDDAGMISTLTLQDSGSTWWSMTARRMLDIDVRAVGGACRAGPVGVTTWDDERTEVRSVVHLGAESSDFLEEWGYAPMARAVRDRIAGTDHHGGRAVLATVDDGVECARLVQQARRSVDARAARPGSATPQTPSGGQAA